MHSGLKLSLRVTLPLAVSICEISAGANCDDQAGLVGVVGHRQLQLPSHRDALEEAAVCADAAAAALRKKITGCSLSCYVSEKRKMHYEGV